MIISFREDSIILYLEKLEYLDDKAASDFGGFKWLEENKENFAGKTMQWPREEGWNDKQWSTKHNSEI